MHGISPSIHVLFHLIFLNILYSMSQKVLRMVANALWISEAFRDVPWLRPRTRLWLMQGLRPRHNPACLHNARATILNPFIIPMEDLRQTRKKLWLIEAEWRIYASVNWPSLVQIWHYLNQCWNIVNWTLRNKLQWNFNRNRNIFVQENALENVVCEMASFWSRPQWVKEKGISLGSHYWYCN